MLCIPYAFSIQCLCNFIHSTLSLQRTEEGKPRTEEVIDLRQMEEIKALDDQVTFFLQTSSNNGVR